MNPAPVRRQRRETLTDLKVRNLERRSKPYFHPDPELAAMRQVTEAAANIAR